MSYISDSNNNSYSRRKQNRPNKLSTVSSSKMIENGIGNSLPKLAVKPEKEMVECTTTTASASVVAVDSPNETTGGTMKTDETAMKSSPIIEGTSFGPFPYRKMCGQTEESNNGQCMYKVKDFRGKTRTFVLNDPESKQWLDRLMVSIDLNQCNCLMTDNGSELKLRMNKTVESMQKVVVGLEAKKTDNNKAQQIASATISPVENMPVLAPENHRPANLKNFVCNLCGTRYSNPDTLEAHQVYYCSKRVVQVESQTMSPQTSQPKVMISNHQTDPASPMVSIDCGTAVPSQATATTVTTVINRCSPPMGAKQATIREPTNPNNADQHSRPCSSTNMASTSACASAATINALLQSSAAALTSPSVILLPCAVAENDLMQIIGLPQTVIPVAVPKNVAMPPSPLIIEESLLNDVDFSSESVRSKFTLPLAVKSINGAVNILYPANANNSAAAPLKPLHFPYGNFQQQQQQTSCDQCQAAAARLNIAKHGNHIEVEDHQQQHTGSPEVQQQQQCKKSPRQKATGTQAATAAPATMVHFPIHPSALMHATALMQGRAMLPIGLRQPLIAPFSFDQQAAAACSTTSLSPVNLSTTSTIICPTSRVTTNQKPGSSSVAPPPPPAASSSSSSIITSQSAPSVLTGGQQLQQQQRHPLNQSPSAAVTVAPPPPLPVKAFPCPNCSATFSSQKTLDGHLTFYCSATNERRDAGAIPPIGANRRGHHDAIGDSGATTTVKSTNRQSTNRQHRQSQSCCQSCSTTGCYQNSNNSSSSNNCCCPCPPMNVNDLLKQHVKTTTASASNNQSASSSSNNNNAKSGSTTTTTAGSSGNGSSQSQMHFTCDQCGFKARSNKMMKSHMNNAHSSSMKVLVEEQQDNDTKRSSAENMKTVAMAEIKTEPKSTFSPSRDHQESVDSSSSSSTGYGGHTPSPQLHCDNAESHNSDHRVDSDDGRQAPNAKRPRVTSFTEPPNSVSVLVVNSNRSSIASASTTPPSTGNSPTTTTTTAMDNNGRKRSAVKNVQSDHKDPSDHYNNDQQRLLSFLCDRCGKKFKSSQAFNDHKCAMMTMTTKAQDQMDIQDNCGMVTTSPVTNGQIYKCQYCTYVSPYKGNLKRHLSLVHKHENDNSTSPLSSCGNNSMDLTVD